MMLGSDQTFDGLPDAVAQNALFGVLYIYVANGDKILAGILGLLLAGHRSLLTVLLVGLMFLWCSWYPLSRSARIKSPLI